MFNISDSVIATKSNTAEVEILSGNRAFDRLFDPESIVSVVTTNLSRNFEKYGIAPELVKRLYDDSVCIKVNTRSLAKSKLNIIYVSRSNNNEREDLIRVIAVFNQLNSADFYICCSGKYHLIMQRYINENIKLLTKSQLEKGNIQVDVIITYGSLAIHFVKQLIPVIILGTHGLGGWITPDNFFFLLRGAFMGRPGGTIGETLPVELLAEELLNILDAVDINNILVETKTMADALLCIPLSDKAMLIKKTKQVLHQINNKVLELTPKLASNIVVIRGQDCILLKRKCVHDVVATVGFEDFKFLTLLNGKNSLFGLIAKTSVSQTELWDFLELLWQKKIVLFNEL